MPKFMKDKAIELIDSGLETYFLALYGLTIPNVRTRKKQESKYAPVMGLFGAATELLIKACLVQEKGLGAMYKDGSISWYMKDSPKAISNWYLTIENSWWEF